MQKILLLIFLHCCFFSLAQTKLNFNYDQAGNQITRTLCINCSAKSAKDIVEPEALTENDLQKFSAEDVISYYPNPVREELYLQWELTHDNYVASVHVYSITGQVLRTFQPNSNTNNLSIPFQQYSAGVYLVLLSYKNGGEKSIKIIKK
ncbi:T9SS type A sorting domain-containing protein [Flavobacterium sp. LPB0248]|uniref:T9SS type A sorting domain-containing protein n=1 Tax=Flavobacterium sp. LPB0248 TaxID=2614441 RepID=UPI0015A6858D|nr:T9SS type A sorting domain-containing protein [Flavobacterium sp. LPB0248]QLC67021.1 T9SS type A sorting domain-containing protein [Flavobacterium sp. LPB0248]